MEETTEMFVDRCVGGLSVDGGSIPGYSAVDKSDLTIVPDLPTFQIFEMNQENVAIVWCHVVFSDGKRHPADPRNVLHKVIEKLASMGYGSKMFAELEFYLVDEKTNQPIDHAAYMAMPPEDAGFEFRHRLGDYMTNAGASPH